MPRVPEISKGRIYTLRERPVKEFIDRECGSFDVLTISSDASPEEILDKILDPENREDAVVVIAHKSEAPTVGLITNIDFLEWIRRKMAERKPIPKTAGFISNTDFFFVTEDQPLQKAISLMKKNKVTHVMVLNNEKEKMFRGWVTRRSILKKLGAELGGFPT